MKYTLVSGKDPIVWGVDVPEGKKFKCEVQAKAKGHKLQLKYQIHDDTTTIRDPSCICDLAGSIYLPSRFRHQINHGQLLDATRDVSTMDECIA